MRAYLVALGFALLPALGNFFGGVLAEIFTVREQLLSYALHAAAGVVLAVVGLELMPQALATDAPWLPILALVLGGGFFLLADHAMGVVSARFGGNDGRPRGRSTSGWARICSPMGS